MALTISSLFVAAVFGQTLAYKEWGLSFLLFLLWVMNIVAIGYFSTQTP